MNNQAKLAQMISILTTSYLEGMHDLMSKVEQIKIQNGMKPQAKEHDPMRLILKNFPITQGERMSGATLLAIGIQLFERMGFPKGLLADIKGMRRFPAVPNTNRAPLVEIEFASLGSGHRMLSTFKQVFSRAVRCGDASSHLKAFRANTGNDLQCAPCWAKKTVAIEDGGGDGNNSNNKGNDRLAL